MNIIHWIARLVAAVIMLQTLFFKFTGAEESVYIFTTLGVEPWGRIGSGIVELIASVLILLPYNRLVVLGAALGAMTMLGAIASHILFLGFVVKDDGGQLFIYACITLISCVLVLWHLREEIPNYLP